MTDDPLATRSAGPVLIRAVALLGSTTEAVLRHADRPALLLPAAGNS